MNTYGMIGVWVGHLSRTHMFRGYESRIDVLITAWKLGEYPGLLRDPSTRYFVERLQRLLYAIIASIDEDESAGTWE